MIILKKIPIEVLIGIYKTVIKNVMSVLNLKFRFQRNWIFKRIKTIDVISLIIIIQKYFTII